MGRLIGCKPLAFLSAPLLHGNNTIQICTAAAAPELGIPMSDGGACALEGGPSYLCPFLCCLITFVREAFLQLYQKGVSCSCVLPVTLWAETW